MTDAAPDLADDFDVIAPAGRLVLLAGEPLELAPLTIGQIPRVMRALRGVDLRQFDGNDVQGLADLMADHGEGIITAVAVAARQQESVVAALALDDFLALLVGVLEVNADFFVRRVAPAMRLTLARVTRHPLRAGPGPTRSSN